MASASFIGAAPGSVPFLTFFSPGRLWAVHLSFAAASNNTYVAGSIAQLYARILAGANVIGIIELALSAAAQQANGDADPAFPGFPVPGGTVLSADVNNGVTVTGVLQRASGVVWYSIP